jgi:hypothetical protein
MDENCLCNFIKAIITIVKAKHILNAPRTCLVNKDLPGEMPGAATAMSRAAFIKP